MQKVIVWFLILDLCNVFCKNPVSFSSGGSSGGGRGAQPPYCRESHGAPLSPLYKFERKERRGWRRKKMKQPLLLVISVPPLIGRSNQNL